MRASRNHFSFTVSDTFCTRKLFAGLPKLYRKANVRMDTFWIGVRNFLNRGAKGTVGASDGAPSEGSVMFRFEAKYEFLYNGT